MKNVFLLYFIFSIISFDCYREDPCDEIESSESSISINLKPEQLSYAIGDTMWLSTRFDIDLELTDKEENINVSNTMNWLNLYLMQLDGGKEIEKGYADFDIINEYGELSQELIPDEITKNYQGELTFNCDTLFCSFLIGIVPKVRGNYCLVANFGWINADNSGFNCGEGVSLRNNTFNVTSLNREIYEALNINFDVELPTKNSAIKLNLIDNNGAFAFKVE